MISCLDTRGNRALHAPCLNQMSTTDEAITLGNSRLYLIGRLGRAVEVKEYGAGKFVGNTSLAVTQEGSDKCEW